MILRFGLRSQLSAAMVGVALASVLIAIGASTLAVDRAVDHFGREDLQLSADHTGAVAADFYLREPVGWSGAKVATLARLEAVQGHNVIVRDASGAILPGSTPSQSTQHAFAPVIAQGHRVGQISLAHFKGGFLRLRDAAGFTSELHEKLRWLHLLAGLVAVGVGLAIAIAVAMALFRPVHRLRAAAERIEAGDLETTVDSGGGAAELQQLGRTLGRVSTTLKRAEEVRRETISDLAHELRTPVTGLRARIEAAQDGVLDDMPAVLAAMHSDVLRLGHLMEDFERLAEAQRPGLLLERQIIDLAALSRDRARAFEGYFLANGIHFLLDIEPASASGDTERLGQVIDNLLSNALRYTDAGGRVILRVIGGGQQSMIEVADTGLGIGKEDLGRIFDRFWRGEKSRSRATGGSGLGLALVHELVAAQGGRVDVESIRGRGSRFRVYLPVGAPRATPLIDVEERQTVAVARIAADVGREEWRAVEAALLARVPEGGAALVVDLSDLPGLDARGVAALLAAQAQLAPRDGRLAVVCAEGTPALTELRLAGAHRSLLIVDTVDDAVEAVVGVPAAA